MSDIKIKQIKEHLSGMENHDLIKEITELAKLFPEVKEYYNLKINPEAEKNAFEKYAKIVKNEFYPDRGFGKLRYSVINKAISDFKKIARRPEDIAELMLMYPELGIEFTNDFGYIDDRFYNNICSAYEKALEYIYLNDLQGSYQEGAQKAIDSIDDGWGFQDVLIDIFVNYFEPEEE